MEEQRIDKWLWCARFYKTRTLAADAIKAGRIWVNGQLAKPSRMVKTGDELVVNRPPFTAEIRVLGVAKQRGSATVAATLFEESPQSIAARQALAERLRLSAVIEDPRQGKLSGRDRREREALKRSGWD